jgi:hypothetical protein
MKRGAPKEGERGRLGKEMALGSGKATKEAPRSKEHNPLSKIGAWG